MPPANNLRVAAQSAGVAGVLAVALEEVIRLLRVHVTGQHYRRILTKQYTGSSITLSATSGVTSDFISSDFKNDGKYPWIMQGLWPTTTTGTSAWKLSVKDIESGETFFGSPNRVPTTAIVASDRRPTGLGILRHEIGPNGGIIPTAESVGSADVVVLCVTGFWVVEE